MECPVTLQKMITPRVLPCGHTFDEKSLVRLSRCPLCRKAFHVKSIKELPINWIIVGQDNYYKMICETTNNEKMKMFVDVLQNVTLKILYASEVGLSSIIISFNIVKRYPKKIRQEIYRMILLKLRTLGFFVCESFDVSCFGHKKPCMIVSWNHRHL